MLKEKGIPIGEKTCVALTMRPYRFPGHKNAVELYDNYKTALSEFIIWLSERGFFPVLVEHVACNLEHESDMSCIKNVVQMLENRCSYGVFSEPSLTCEQMKAIYGCFDYTVGTRFHSVIFSLAEGVPSMAVTYGGNKGQGIMKDLQMDKYAVSIDEISKDKLADVFLNLEHNSKELKKKLMIYQQVLDNEKNSIVNLIRKENGEWQH